MSFYILRGSSIDKHGDLRVKGLDVQAEIKGLRMKEEHSKEFGAGRMTVKVICPCFKSQFFSPLPVNTHSASLYVIICMRVCL